jgi:hypothetical protein
MTPSSPLELPTQILARPIEADVPLTGRRPRPVGAARSDWARAVVSR